MRANDDILLRGEVAHFDVFVGRRRGYFRSILDEEKKRLLVSKLLCFLQRIALSLFLVRWKANPYLGKIAVQNGLRVLKRMTALALSVLSNLVDADLVIPARDGEEVGPVLRR